MKHVAQGDLKPLILLSLGLGVLHSTEVYTEHEVEPRTSCVLGKQSSHRGTSSTLESTLS